MWAKFKKPILTKTSASLQTEGKLDFFKMVCAAMAVGLAFSVAAAVVTLLLAQSATANANNTLFAESTSQPGTANDAGDRRHLAAVAVSADSVSSASALNNPNPVVRIHQPAPGNLLISDGCGGEFIAATERDFQIIVKDGVIDVQVMQTFVLPGTDANTFMDASFHAVLPKDALYSSFRVVTSNRDLIGEYNQHADLNGTYHPEDAGKLQTRGVVRVYESSQPVASNTFSSDPLLDLVEGESIIVTYRYLMPIKSIDGVKQISIAVTDPIYPQDLQQDTHFLPATKIDGRITATVWVVWQGSSANSRGAAAFPKKLRSAPTNLLLEQQRGRITGAIWQTTDVQPGDQFTLAW